MLLMRYLAIKLLLSYELFPTRLVSACQITELILYKNTE